MNKLREYILSNRVYAKCNEEEKKAILNELEKIECLEELLCLACGFLSETYMRTTCGEWEEKCPLPFCKHDTCRYNRRLTPEEWMEELKKGTISDEPNQN